MKADHAFSFIRNPWLKITPPIQFNDAFELTARASKKLNTRMAKLILEDKGSRTAAANVFNKCSRMLFKMKHVPDVKQGDLPGIAQQHPRLWRIFMQAYLWATNTTFAMDFPRIASVWHGVACFSEDPRNRLMWTHYADKFTGVVIGFDSRNAFFRKAPLKKVIYSNQRVILPEPVLGRDRPPPSPPWRRINMLSGMDRLARTKQLQFKYEKEWRIILLLANCRKRMRGMYFRRMPHSCIRDVIIGPRCDANLRKTILRHVKMHLPEVKVKTLVLDQASYQLRLQKTS